MLILASKILLQDSCALGSWAGQSKSGVQYVIPSTVVRLSSRKLSTRQVTQPSHGVTQGLSWVPLCVTQAYTREQDSRGWGTNKPPAGFEHGGKYRPSGVRRISLRSC